MGKYKAGEIITKVTKQTGNNFSHYDHNCLYTIFSIRPKSSDFKSKGFDRFETNSNYCIYDEAHEDYVYSEEWLNFIIDLITKSKLTKENWKESFKQEKKIDIKNYEI